MKQYRVGIIGSSRRGGYGHGLETAFADQATFEVLAIADDDPIHRGNQTLVEGRLTK